MSPSLTFFPKYLRLFSSLIWKMLLGSWGRWSPGNVKFHPLKAQV